MKRIFAFLFATMLVVQAFAYDFQSGDFYYNITSDKEPFTVCVEGSEYTSSNSERGISVVIPQKVTYNEIEYTVTSINGGIFDRCSFLLIIPNSVINIGSQDVRAIFYAGDAEGKPWGARYVCSTPDENGFLYDDNAIEKTQLVAYVGKDENVIVPNCVTTIASFAFSHCDVLKSVSIPNSVTSIDPLAFYGCDKMTSINVETRNTKYTTEDGVLFNKDKTELIYYPSGKTGDYNIPNTVTNIGYDTFTGCSLTSINIPNSITRVYLTGCSNLKSITIPNSVTILDINNCSSLTSVNIPNSVTYFWFENCGGLTSITIPDSVTRISRRTFKNCSNLTTVSIGESVSNIDNGAFEGCTSLKHIICKGLIPPQVDCLTDNIVNDAYLYMNVTLTCPENAKLYRTLQPWCNFDLADNTNIGHAVDTIYVVDTVVNIVSKTDTIFSNRIDTIYVIDTVQSIVNTKDTVYTSRIDTVYSIITTHDTVYFGGQNVKMYNIMVMSANPKMGMAIGTGSYSDGSVVEIFGSIGQIAGCDPLQMPMNRGLEGHSKF